MREVRIMDRQFIVQLSSDLADVLDRLDSFAVGDEIYKLENLSICTGRKNTYCYRCS